MHEEVVEARGHLIDSGIMSRILDAIIESGCSFEIEKFSIGRTNEDFSTARIRVQAPTDEKLTDVLEKLIPLGCYVLGAKDAELKAALKDACVPDDFYSTTNHRTYIRLRGKWVQVEDQRMDAVIRVEGNRARCVKLRDVKAGDLVVCGHAGIKVVPEFKSRDRFEFAFMESDISSERRVEILVKKVAAMLREVKGRQGRIAVVAGPVVVHTGGVEGLAKMIRDGYVQALLGGNAIAVHDIEYALFRTSLGMDLEKGVPVREGHRNHMRAINLINRYGGIRQAVEQGALRSGIMYECIANNVPFVLAGSIRDDGPLPDTITDTNLAQDRYSELLKGVDLVMILGTMLHGIGTGNMIPSWVMTICIDINPAVVTKLCDRGTSQAIGIVTDVGLFLHLLKQEL